MKKLLLLSVIILLIPHLCYAWSISHGQSALSQMRNMDDVADGETYKRFNPKSVATTGGVVGGTTIIDTTAPANVGALSVQDGMQIDSGNVDAQNSTLIAKELMTTTPDGFRKINYANQLVCSPSPVAGDVCFVISKKQGFVFDGAVWINVAYRIYSPNDPSADECNADEDRGTPDVFNTSTGNLFICNGVSGWVTK